MSINVTANQLHTAIREREYDFAKELLHSKIDVNETTSCMSTPLHVAVECYNRNNHDELMQIVNLLLNLNADVNMKDINGFTPLHTAIRYNKGYDIVDVLLQTKLDINATTNTMSTFLHFAVQYYDKDALVDRLLELGVDTKARDDCNQTALYYAVELGEKYAVNALLDVNPDVNDRDNKSAFCLAIMKSSYNSGIGQMFLNRGFIIKTEDFHESQLSLPPFYSETPKKCIEKLLKRVATPHASLECEVLIASVKKGFVDVLKHLLSEDMDVNAPLKKGRTLMHFASEKLKPSVIEELLKHGADLNAMDEENKTPLHYVVTTGLGRNVDVCDTVKVLLENGANANAADSYNMTPLHWSVLKQSKDVVNLLSKYGADLEARDSYGNTPLHIAIHPNSPNVQALLDAGVDVNSVNKSGLTPLHLAALYGGVYNVQLLLYYDAEIFDKNEKNPPYLTCDPQIIKILLENGAMDNIGTEKIPLGLQNSTDQMIKQHKMKILTAKMNYNEIDVPLGMDEFRMKCEEEVERMKRRIEIGLGITLYDVLTKNERDVIGSHGNVSPVFDADKYEAEFPIYASMLKIRVLRANKRNRLMNVGRLCLGRRESSTPGKISDLSNIELRKLIYKTPIDKEKKASVRLDDMDETVFCQVSCLPGEVSPVYELFIAQRECNWKMQAL